MKVDHLPTSVIILSLHGRFREAIAPVRHL